MQMAKDGTSIDMPLDVDDIAQRTTLKVLSSDDTTGRRTRMLSAQWGPNPVEPNEEANNAIGNKKATPGAAPVAPEQKPNGKLNGAPVTAQPKPDTN